jgi:hypothetical protein
MTSLVAFAVLFASSVLAACGGARQSPPAAASTHGHAAMLGPRLGATAVTGRRPTRSSRK